MNWRVFALILFYSMGVEPAVVTLDTAIERALEVAPELQGSLDRITEAELGKVEKDLEFSLQARPSLNFDVGPRSSIGMGCQVAKKFGIGTEVSLRPEVGPRRGLVMQLKQPLFRRDHLSGVYGAQHVSRQAQRSYYLAQIGVILKTVRLAYDVAKCEKLVNLAQASYARLEHAQRAARIKEGMGLCDSMDVYRAELEFKRAEEELTSSQRAYKEAGERLCSLLSLEEVSVEAPFVYEEIDTEGCVELALSERLEIEGSQESIKETVRLAKVAEGRLMPDVDLVVNYGEWWGNRHRNWGIGLATSTDFARSKEKLAVQRAHMAVRGSERRLEELQEQIRMEVKGATSKLEGAKRRIELGEEQVRLAEGGLRLSQVKCEWGFADNFHVVAAEKAYRAAQVALLSAVVERITAEYEFLAAVGLLVERPVVR